MKFFSKSSSIYTNNVHCIFKLMMFNSGYEHYCDYSGASYPSPDWRGLRWYRLTGAAGTRIPETAPGDAHCGTNRAGYLRGAHPSTPGDRVVATICFDDGRDGECYTPVNTTVINCGDYYLYQLPHAPTCNSRYCGEEI